MKRWCSVVVMMLAAGCSDGESSSGAGGEAAGAGGEGGAAPDYSTLYTCEELVFAEAKELSGPGYDPTNGFVGTPQASYVVHATQIYYRPEGETEFFQLAGKVAAQLAQTEGLVAFSLGTDDTCGVARTMGVWASEEALYAFVGSGAHAEAMAKTSDITFSGRTTHWDATPEEVEALTWDVARDKLEDIEPLDFY
jgi:heme-degrading monooxygenase HmoA